jgi:hypothetical protein
MKYGLNDFEIGDVVIYATWGNEIRRTLVEYKDENIKNDRAGFSGVLVDDDNNRIFLNKEPFGVWGYTDQIISVEKVDSNA